VDLQLTGKRAIVTGASRGNRLCDRRYARRRGVTEAEALRSLAAGISIGRIVTAAEVADVVAFLASPRSVAISGAGIAAGGGAVGAIHY
jgi:NAD(P)-dependent dehydrogenase (short-subunit alcohol dehydrogenase family)